MADEFARKQRFVRETSYYDPFVFGDENEVPNRKELQLNSPDIVLMVKDQIEQSQGVG